MLTDHAHPEVLVGALALAGGNPATHDIDPEILVLRVGAALGDLDIVAPAGTSSGDSDEPEERWGER